MKQFCRAVLLFCVLLSISVFWTAALQMKTVRLDSLGLSFPIPAGYSYLSVEDATGQDYTDLIKAGCYFYAYSEGDSYGEVALELFSSWRGKQSFAHLSAEERESLLDTLEQQLNGRGIYLSERYFEGEFAVLSGMYTQNSGEIIRADIVAFAREGRTYLLRYGSSFYGGEQLSPQEVIAGLSLPGGTVRRAQLFLLFALLALVLTGAAIIAALLFRQRRAEKQFYYPPIYPGQYRE